MPTEKFKFAGAQGSLLNAAFEMPVGGKPSCYALFAHCFTCTKDIFSARYITNRLANNNIATLRFDFTGLGQSEGEFANTNFTSNVGDLIAAARAMVERGQSPQLLIGHSLGGAAVLAAAKHIPSIKAVATIGAPSEPAHVAHLFKESLDDITSKGEAEVLLAGRPFTIQKQFLDDIGEVKLSAKIANLNKALIIFHSNHDTTVSIDNARKIYEKAQHPKSFISLDGADHLLTNKKDADYVADVLASWAGRYVSTLDSQVSFEKTRQSEGLVIVAEAGGDGLAQKIYNGKHEMIADEPAPLGGNTGPTPYGYLLSGLGTCTAMTIRMYARHKKISLSRVVVKLSHNRVHQDDCQQPGDSCKIEEISREILLEGDLSASQRESLIAISDKCPVHKTLHGKLSVKTVEVDNID